MAVGFGRQVWAGFSVRDHCVARAYVAEVLLYDRLVIPVPPPSDPKDPASPWDPRAVEYWTCANWDPDKLRRLLRLLRRPEHDRVTIVSWDKRMRERWKQKMRTTEAVLGEHGANLAYVITGSAAMDSIGAAAGHGEFRAVTGYASAAARFTRDASKDGIPVAPLEAVEPVDVRHQELALRIGARFLVPDTPGRPDEYVLEQALEVSGTPEFAQKRREFYAWLDGLPIDRLSEETVLAQAEAALEEWNSLVRQASSRTRTKFVFFAVKLLPAVAELVGALHGLPPGTLPGTSFALDVASCAMETRGEPQRPGPAASPAALIAAAQDRLLPVGPVRALTSSVRYRRWQLAERLHG
jgi:hypothetical protein